MTSFFSSRELSWENARSVCLGFEGDLVSIKNKREMEFIENLTSNTNMWIGLNDRLREDQFVWSDGTPFNSSVYKNWNGGEPNNDKGNEDCVELRGSGWNDVDCSATRFYICERPKGKLSCPAEWIRNELSCYKVGKRLMPWIDAKQDCHASGGHLMKIDGTSEQHFIEVYIRITGIKQKQNYVWIGLNDIEHEGTFTWEVDNSTANFSKWEPGQPNNWGNDQHCVGVGSRSYFGLWNDDYCYLSYFYVCEKPANGISCFQCSSNTSFRDCATKQEIVNCTFPSNYCFKQKNTTGDMKDQEAVYYKGCTSVDQCRQKEKNSLECCEDNLCNTDISCYQCSSNISFAHCARNQTRVNCTLPMNRCVKTTYTSNGDDKIVTYYKGCATTEQCTETAEKPFAECCSDDMCNKESGLSCFECSSTVSHEECQKHHKEVACKSSMDDRCYYASMQQTSQDGSSVTKLFKHGCTNNYYCDNTAELFDECRTSSGACDMRCCSENLCNEANKEDAPTQDAPTQENVISNMKIAYISFGAAFILLLLCFVVAFWSYKKSNRKRMERSTRSRREIIQLDKWELLPEQIKYEEELGRGAFGVVYKAILNKRPGIEVFDSRKGLESAKANLVVAVKELQDDPSEMQKEEFLFEIAMMKLLGAHQNIVSLVGCCTLQEHKFLVIEYVPFGDLLQWLRRKRSMINPNGATARQTTEKCYDDKGDIDIRQSKSCQENIVLQDKDHFSADPDPDRVGSTLQDGEKITVSSGNLAEDNRVFQDKYHFSADPDPDRVGSTLQDREKHTVSSGNLAEGIDVVLAKSQEDQAVRGNTPIQMEPSLCQRNKGSSEEMASMFSLNPVEKTDVVPQNKEEDQVLTDQTSVKMEPALSCDNEASILSFSSDNIVEDESKPFLDQENIELSAMPSTSQRNNQTAENLISTENLDDGNEEDDSFSTQQLFSFAWQIARGMNHLAEKDFVHRDLAARNVLVGHDNRVKVSDFGLMRQIYEDVYSAKKTKKLPVKWMAPESIHDSVFTIKSDVWSYGVLLWEMATMGGVPYPTMTNAELCRALKNGYRMERPEMCCDEVYELMTECWEEDPTARPSFSQLIDRLETIMTMDVPYCDVSKHDESSSYYKVPVKAVEDSG
ncbi:uncharacterized protein LOC144640230 [Oculina patagonica]